MNLFKSKPKFSLQEAEAFFKKRMDAPEETPKQELLDYCYSVLVYLNEGKVRVWDPATSQVNAWCKLAIMGFFKSSDSEVVNSGCFEYIDKLPPKSLASLKGVRVVPGAVARFGSFIESGAILMPSFVNIGAYVGSGTMVDTWATVGSCAQIGSNVHLSGGVGIGGVLEPAQASPVIVEDGAFLGSRVIVVEGVRIGKEAVLGAGVTLTASSKIIDVRGEKPIITSGFVPPNSVVIPGTQSKQFPAGEFQVPCALIIGTRSKSTNLKTSLNDALRDYSLSV